MQPSEPCLEWLDSLKTRGMSLGVENTRRAIEYAIGDLAQLPTTIHVAGSNGKGTLCSALSAQLCSTGKNVTLFTSPHLFDYRERVRVNGIPLAQDRFVKHLNKIMRIDEEGELGLTYFEVGMVLSCIEAVANQGYLILETGLGGRLDATRSIPAEYCLLTSLSVEHSEILGSTIEQIAHEKSMIARPGSKLITPRYSEEVREVIQRVVSSCFRPELGEFDSPAQWIECSSTQYSMRELVELFCNQLGVSTSNLDSNMEHSRWPCRGEFVTSPEGIDLFLDSAHNPSGMKYMVNRYAEKIKLQLKNQKSNCKVIFGTSPQSEMDSFVSPLLGMLKDLDIDQIILSKPTTGRYPGVNPSELIEYQWPCADIVLLESVEEVQSHLAGYSGLVICTGSIYMLGELVEVLGIIDDEYLTIH